MRRQEAMVKRQMKKRLPKNYSEEQQLSPTFRLSLLLPSPFLTRRFAPLPPPPASTPYVEIVGACGDDGSVQHFVTRALGDDFNLETYDSMIELQNGKYNELFVQEGFVR